MSLFVKDPDAVLDYQWDWTAWLGTGETIVSHVLTVPAGLTLQSDTATSTTVTAWLSGGTDGQRYDIVCRITTNAGRTDDRTMTLVMAER